MFQWRVDGAWVNPISPVLLLGSLFATEFLLRRLWFQLPFAGNHVRDCCSISKDAGFDMDRCGQRAISNAGSPKLTCALPNLDSGDGFPTGNGHVQVRFGILAFVV